MSQVGLPPSVSDSLAAGRIRVLSWKLLTESSS
jgi:hypothetical protein